MNQAQDNLDKETLQVLKEGQTIADFVKSDGWMLAKRKLTDKLSLLNSISNTIFENKSPQDLAIELQSRAGAIKLIEEWLAEVEGWAEQHKSNQEISNVQEEIIYRT